MTQPSHILKSLGALAYLCAISITPSVWAKNELPPAFILNQPPERSGVKRMVLRAKTSDQVFLSFRTKPTEPFLRFAKAARQMTELRGSFTLGQGQYPCVGSFPVLPEEQALHTAQPVVLTGKITGPGCEGSYKLTLSVLPATAHRTEGLALTLTAPESYQQTELSIESHPGPYYGLGMQFDAAALEGTYPMVVQEGGIGRGLQPLSWLMNTVSPGSSGHKSSSYFPLPMLWSLQGNALQLMGSHPAQFVVPKTSAEPLRIEMDHHRLTLNVFYEPTPLRLLTTLTAEMGRQPQLPDWFHRGAVVGIQGGDAKVLSVAQKLKKRGTPIAGYWLQDWVGKRATAIGSQLWWNWSVNTRHYPGWPDLKEQLPLLGYINPFLVDVPGEFGHNYYQEALNKGYFVKDHTGKAYPVKNTDFSAGLLDLSHPEVGPWIKDIIKKELIAHAGFKGWMADYAEALPLDAVIHTGDAHAFHNAYPAVWARLNAEAIAESGCTDCVFFMRSGYTGSLQSTPLFWEGDQLVSWDAQDGLASALNGLLSGGLSGIAVNHSDAGGYTSVAHPIWGGYARSSELLYRWLEMNAFTAVLRTHEGNQPERNAQIYSSPAHLDAFDRSAKIYAALFDYRKTLLEEAHTKGWPVVRHMVLHYPRDPVAQTLQTQFMLGSELLVAPVLQAGERTKKVYLPAGNWTHLWSDQTDKSQEARWVTVAAPPGSPAVFYPENSRVGSHLRKTLINQAKIELFN